jgi:YVTN family beta-propeller protein
VYATRTPVPGTAGAIAVSPDGGTVYVGINQNGKLIMISTSTNQVSQTVQVAKRGEIEFATGP